MLRAISIALVGILVGACGSSDEGTSTPGAASSSTTSFKAATTSGTTAVGDLADLVVPNAPSPYVPAPDEVPSGSFDLASFVKNFSTAEDEDRRMLTDCGFTRGFSRPWFDESNGRVLAIFVFECSTGAAASSLHEGMEEQARRLKSATAFEAPTIVGARGQTYLEDVEDEQARVEIVSFVRGSRLYSIGSQSDSKDGHRDSLIQLATSEAAVAR